MARSQWVFSPDSGGTKIKDVVSIDEHSPLNFLWETQDDNNARLDLDIYIV